MSMIKDYMPTTKPPSTVKRSSCFLGCFVCSGKKTQPKDKVNFGSRRRWISKWNFSFKKSATKTVPVDLSTNSRNSKSLVQLSKKHPPATSNTTWEIQLVEEEDATLTTSDDKIIPPKKRILKQQNGPTRSPRNETNVAAATAVVVSSHLKPLTQKPRDAPVAVGGGGKGAVEKPVGFDSVIGMSVILVILVIMVLWGKIWAILCTSAWFFIAPRVLAGGERSGLPTAKKRRQDVDNDDLDLESTEYKKKVVLEGLLQRNHRNIVVGKL